MSAIPIDCASCARLPISDESRRRVLKLMAGGSAGDSSLLRTLEVSAIGLHGKVCMWRTSSGARAPAAPRPNLARPQMGSGAAGQVTLRNLQAHGVHRVLEHRRTDVRLPMSRVEGQARRRGDRGTGRRAALQGGVTDRP